MMTYKDMVSVGIPTYNRADKLVEAVNSVISQNYKNHEINEDSSLLSHMYLD